MEADIIKKHMWPLTIIPPRYMESLIVSLVDTYCSAMDYLCADGNNKILKFFPFHVIPGSGE